MSPTRANVKAKVINPPNIRIIGLRILAINPTIAVIIAAIIWKKRLISGLVGGILSTPSLMFFSSEAKVMESPCISIFCVGVLASGVMIQRMM